MEDIPRVELLRNAYNYFCDHLHHFIYLIKIVTSVAPAYKETQKLKSSTFLRIEVGNKIYYRLSDIQRLLNDNYNSK